MLNKLDIKQQQVIKSFLNNLEQNIYDYNSKKDFTKVLFECYEVSEENIYRPTIIVTAEDIIRDYEESYDNPYWKSDIVANARGIFNMPYQE